MAQIRVGVFPPLQGPSPVPEVQAAFVALYAAAGCTSFNLIPQSPDVDTAVAGAAEVKRLLASA